MASEEIWWTSISRKENVDPEWGVVADRTDRKRVLVRGQPSLTRPDDSVNIDSLIALMIILISPRTIPQYDTHFWACGRQCPVRPEFESRRWSAVSPAILEYRFTQQTLYHCSLEDSMRVADQEGALGNWKDVVCLEINNNKTLYKNTLYTHNDIVPGHLEFSWLWF